MRDEQRGTKPPRARQNAPAGKTGQSRPLAPKTGARPISPKSRGDAYTVPAASKPRAAQGRPNPDFRQRNRREAEYLYPDDAYYKKASGKAHPASMRKPAKSKKGKKKRTNPLYVLFYLAFAVVTALLISFLLRTFVFEIVRVNGDAMARTLMPGDWVIVTKFDYWTSDPELKEIVAVNVSSKDGVILRRIVGLPEQRVEIDSNGDTLINGELLGEEYVTLKSFDEYPEITLNRGRYFVLSDNRDNEYEIKLDSRSDSVGMVAKKDIVGKVRGIVWPPNRRG